MSADSEVTRSYREPPGVRVPAGAFTLLAEVCRGLASAVEAPRLYGYAHRDHNDDRVVLRFHPAVVESWDEFEEESQWAEVWLGSTEARQLLEDLGALLGVHQ